MWCLLRRGAAASARGAARSSPSATPASHPLVSSGQTSPSFLSLEKEELSELLHVSWKKVSGYPLTLTNWGVGVRCPETRGDAPVSLRDRKQSMFLDCLIPRFSTRLNSEACLEW